MWGDAGPQQCRSPRGRDWGALWGWGVLWVSEWNSSFFHSGSPHPPRLTAHFVYDPKMNRPTEVPSLLAQPSWMSGGVESGPLGRAVGAWVAVFMGCRLRQGRSEAGLGRRPAWSCPASPV